jgi:succinylglutamate desuccinylase
LITSRIIAEHHGHKPGPLLIVLGAVHGNEPAGVKAIELVSKMLQVEPITNPEFEYRGNFLGLIGNLGAYSAGRRYLSRDLNRSFLSENIDFVRKLPLEDLHTEYAEMKVFLETIHSFIHRTKPEKVVVLDMHTTSSGTGIFTFCSDDPDCLKVASELNVPVITGVLKGLRGTTLNYFLKDNIGADCICIAFESGQHDDPLSINRAIAGIINCMKIIGSVDQNHVENIHNNILSRYSQFLPNKCKLIARHPISDAREFKMLPGFNNFDKIHEGQLLAYDHGDEVFSPCDGLILMPLYQDQGEEGFFIVEELV